MKIFLDGTFVDAAEAKISVFDHGLLYGDGVFEGIRAYHGRVFKLEEHIDRLFYSAKAILLDIPIFITGSLPAVVFYIVSQRELYPRSWWREVLYLPALLALTIGLAVNNAWAVIQGMFGVDKSDHTAQVLSFGGDVQGQGGFTG